MKSRIQAFQSSKLAILWDDAPGLSRGVLVAPAAYVSTEQANLLFTLTGGLPFVALSPERTASFMLSPMTRPLSAPANFSNAHQQCISVEAREGVSTGISASDRATTIRILGEENPSPRKLVKPGHIFPVEVKAGGVLVKSALPEASLDLVKIGGFSDAALYLDILDQAGALETKTRAQEIAKQNQIPFIELAELVRFRLENELLVERVAEAKLPTKLAGELRAFMYRSKINGEEHVALVKGEIDPEAPTLTRVQPERTFEDIFGSGLANSSRANLQTALSEIGNQGQGVLVYLRTKREHSPDRNAAMMREYGVGAQVLRDLGVKKIKLLTGSTKNLVGLRSFGIEIVAQIPLNPSQAKNQPSPH